MLLVLLLVTHGRGNQKPSINLRKASNILLLSTDLFHFSCIARRHCWILKPSRNPHWYFKKIFSKNGGICLNVHFSYIFENLEECWLVFSFLRYIFYLLYNRVISACLRISGNVDSFMELLKQLQRKLRKISVFSFTTSIGYLSILMPYLHLVLKSLFQFVSDQPK